MPREIEGAPIREYDTSVTRHVPKEYETNKMRYWLKAVGRSEGMLARHGYYATFYDGMALNIPNYYSIWVQGSDEMIKRYPEQLWKSVMIWKTDLTFDQQIAKMQYQGIVSDIRNIPIFGNFIGGTIQDITDKALKIEQLQSIKHYNVWDNILYKHTLGNNVLKANFGKVLAEIVPLIGKKYG